MLTVSQLFIYPVKSLGGIKVSSTRIMNRGLQYDRRFMLVNKDNHFLTQREIPAMALFCTAIEGKRLVVSFKPDSTDKIAIPLLPGQVAEKTMVRVWDDDCEAQFISRETDQWFSDRMATNCRLVYMPESTNRRVDARYAVTDSDITSFSDGYPILMIGQSSLDDLNSRLPEALPMNRFRPNIVFSGGKPFQEDNMKHFNINGIDFYGVKPCARCIVTTTDQETGARGKEPLKTLSTYRSKDHKVLFGQNVLMSGGGIIHVGDSIRFETGHDAL